MIVGMLTGVIQLRLLVICDACVYIHTGGVCVLVGVEVLYVLLCEGMRRVIHCCR